MKPPESRWSRHVWFWGFVFLFLSHAFAVFWLAERENFAPSWHRPVAFLYLSGNPDTHERLAQQAGLRDPTLFALPHLEGFSGSAWLNFQPQAPPLSNWTAPPEWLSLPAEDLGKSLDEYVATNRPSEDRMLASLRATRTPEVRIPDRPLVTNSTASLQGSIASRKLMFSPAVPEVPTNDVVASTVVSVAVNGDGVVESASVAKSSGSRWADDRGLELARAFVFEPLADGGAIREAAPPDFGQVTFKWNTFPVTNGPPLTIKAP